VHSPRLVAAATGLLSAVVSAANRALRSAANAAAASDAAGPFWETLGFERAVAVGYSHRLRL
jgi:hypothetical protein